MLKGISQEKVTAFKREIRTLDEVRESGIYLLVGNNISENEGLPSFEYCDCKQCYFEALLEVSRNSTLDGKTDKEAIGQKLTITNSSDGSTNTYCRSWSAQHNNAKWTNWQMSATGDPKLISENNEINQVFSQLNETVAHTSTINFDRIEEQELIINEGKLKTIPIAIIYYKPRNIFVAEDNKGNYWSTWDGMNTFIYNGVVHKNKVYLCNKKIYLYDGNTLYDAGEAEEKRATAAEHQLQQELNNLKEKVVTEDILSYGVEFDVTVSSPICTRIGNATYHRTLPIHSAMRRCLLDDNGNVTAYLDANDSTKTADGADADLTGAKGMVMVEIPKHYRKFKREGNKQQVLISQFPLAGYHEVPRMYRSAYEATIDRTDSSKLKLASVVNTSSSFRGGDNTAEWDNTYRSQLGIPATKISLTNSRAYARNRGTAGRSGAGWNCDLYEAQLTTYWLYIIEYANRHSQASYNAELTSEGYRQGGLGAGVTTLSATEWVELNGESAFVPCGVTNRLGNNTGVVQYEIPAKDGAGETAVSVPSYRGIENPFGHINKWTDGCKCYIESDADGGASLFYTCYDPALFNDSSYEGYTLKGPLSRKEGFIKDLIFGENGDNAPASVGGGSTTYYADFLSVSVPSSGIVTRCVCFGDRAKGGTYAGLSSFRAYNPASFTSVAIGNRLCFLPEK